MPKPQKPKCFNCTSPRITQKVPLCRDCLRMAIITSAFGGVSTETIHRLFGWLVP